VVTAWSVRTFLPQATNTTLRPVVIGGDTAVAKGAQVDAPEWAGVATFGTRLPIAAGQLVGVELATTGGMLYFPSFRAGDGAASNMRFWDPPLAEGETRPPLGNQTNAEILLQATVEPDTDGDGFGDESQDGCVGTPGPLAGCPAPPTAPETQIDAGPGGKITKPKATFTFSSPSAGATFECSSDKSGFSECRSPKKLKRLANGKHLFRVRAVSPEGLIDRSPAEQKFKVKRK
jgi:hypothetical protein